MKKFLISMLLFVCVQITFGQVTLFSSAIGADGATKDTVFYDISKLDYFGVYVAADSAASFVLYFDARGSAAGNGNYWGQTTVNSKASTYPDSLTVTGTTGGSKIITLRSPKIENIPWGANFLRVIRINKASGGGSTTKLCYLVLDGIRTRTYRVGE